MSESLSQKVYQIIRDDITYGRLSPGERLVECKLTKQLRISRSPVREALRQLESEGLITLERNQGATVSKLSIVEVDEIYSLRCLLEGYSARLSAERADNEGAKYLTNLQKLLKAAARNNDLMNWLHNNTLFHDFFSEHSGNNNLIQTLSTLKRRVYRYKYIIIRIPGHFQNYVKQHEEILRGYKGRNGDIAEKYMKLHVATMKNVLIDYLAKFPGH